MGTHGKDYEEICGDCSGSVICEEAITTVGLPVFYDDTDSGFPDSTERWNK